MASAVTDLLDRVTDSTTGRPVVSALAAPGKAVAAPSVNITDATNWTTTTGIHFSIYNTVTVGGVIVKDPTTQTDWKGTLAGTTISNMTLTGGTDRSYTVGAIVELTPTARYAKDVYEWGAAFANQDGSLKSAAVQTALGLGAATLNGWNALGFAPGSVTYSGNRSYSMVFNGTDQTGTLSSGMRLRTTRTVAAPTQCTSLNGTTQFYSKTSPAGMTFTNNFVVSGWVKLAAYPTVQGDIISRYNGTSGWAFSVQPNGQIQLAGFNAGGSNFSLVKSYQSAPLNKWIHVAAQLDMASFTASPTTSYVMIDGVDVPSTVIRSGTNPTALIQAGNLEVGSENTGAFPLNGKIAQVAVFSAKVTEATMQGYMSQGLAGTETSLISAYSFNNTINDLNANANNLTANGSAVATNADSPFGGQAGGTISSTLDYGIVQSVVFSTNTTVVVQVPEGCTIPTSGGVSSVAYSSNIAPYGFPKQRQKWQVTALWISSVLLNTTIATWSSGATNGTLALSVPAGEWDISLLAHQYGDQGSSVQATHFYSINTVNNTPSTNLRFVGTQTAGNGSVSTFFGTSDVLNGPISTSTTTSYYALFYASGASGNHQLNVGSGTGSYLEVTNAYL